MKSYAPAIALVLFLCAGCSTTGFPSSPGELGSTARSPSLQTLNRAYPPLPIPEPLTSPLLTQDGRGALNGGNLAGTAAPRAASGAVADDEREKAVRLRALIQELETELDRARTREDRAKQLEDLAIERAGELDALASEIDEKARNLATLLAAEQARTNNARVRD